MAAKMPRNLRGCALEQLCKEGQTLKMPDWGPQVSTGERAPSALPRPH